MKNNLIKTYLKKIQSNFPEISTENVELITKGWDNDVLIIEDRYVFRFPKRVGYDEYFKSEVKLLAEIAPRLSVNVPHYTYLPADLSFGGYRIVPGIELTPEVYAKISMAEKMRVATQIGDFLSVLHATPAETARACGLKIEADNFRWSKPNVENLLSKLKLKIFPKLDKDEVEWAQRQFQSYLSLSFDFDNRLAHSDLTQDHIFVDPETHEVSGIIDFADMDFVDPSIDFAGFWKFGTDLPELVAQHYTLGADPDLLERSKFPWLAHMLDNMLELEESEGAIPVTFESSKAKLRSVMSSGLEIRQSCA